MMALAVTLMTCCFGLVCEHHRFVLCPGTQLVQYNMSFPHCKLIPVQA